VVGIAPGRSEFPSGGAAIAWLAAGAALYALATLVRGERWHRILHKTGVEAKRSDSYGLTAVGYMGNNVLPARAGEMLRVVLLNKRADASKRTLIGTIVASDCWTRLPSPRSSWWWCSACSAPPRSRATAPT